MRKFLKRLGLCIAYPVGLTLAILLMVLLMYCIATYTWIAITCCIIFVIMAIPIAIDAAVQFINWLFIDPFKTKKEAK